MRARAIKSFGMMLSKNKSILTNCRERRVMESSDEEFIHILGTVRVKMKKNEVSKTVILLLFTCIA